MRTIVDRTREALHVEVCSFYLLDHDTDRLTLAATNGLDRDHVGRVSLALGEGMTGRPRRPRRPDRGPRRAARPALQVRPRLRPGRAHLDALGAAHLERPRRRRPQRPDRRDAAVHPARDRVPGHDRGPPRRASSRRAASRREQEHQLETLTAARRGPGRAARRSSPTSCGPRSRSCGPTSTCSPTRAGGIERGAGRGRARTTGATRPSTRSRGSTGSSTRSSSRSAARAWCALARSPFDVGGGRRRDRSSCSRRSCATTGSAGSTPARRSSASGDEAALPPGAGAPPRERGEVRPAAARACSVGRVGPGRRGPGLRHRRRAGHPDRGVGVGLRGVRAQAQRARARLRHRAVRGAAPAWRRWAAGSGSRETGTVGAGSSSPCPRPTEPLTNGSGGRAR